MDFRQNLQNIVNRPAQSSEPRPVTPEAPESSEAPKPVVVKENKISNLVKSPMWLNVMSVVVLVGAALLIILAALSFGRTNVPSESRYVNTGAYQAIFLNNGQVYFGKVQALNTQYINVTDVYYLTQSATTTGQASGDYTLVKLGCQQIHHPEDRMIIGRAQVTFWENLSGDGKVVKSIADYKKQYPNGNCDTNATTTQTPATNLPSQSGTNTTAPTTTTTAPTTTKPTTTTPAAPATTPTQTTPTPTTPTTTR